MAADLLTLRRAVAEVLPNRPPRSVLAGDVWRCTALWVWDRAVDGWLPVLTDPGTVGVMLAELERRGVWPTIYAQGERSAVVYTAPDGRWHRTPPDTRSLGEALARALVGVAS